jgi:hypothetical protein
MGTEFDFQAAESAAITETYLERVKLALTTPRPLREKKPEGKKRAGGKTFTTKYAKIWGKKQGWKLRASEHVGWGGLMHDVGPGADAEFETETGFVYVQGAGRHERAPHFQRFIDRGGVAFCQKRNAKFVYLEFERGSTTPVLEEWWA